MNRLWFAMIACIALTLGCGLAGRAASSTTPEETIVQTAGPNVTDAPTSEPTPVPPLGTLRLETEQVLHGPAEAALVPLLESAPFFVKDLIQVIDGGEAVLDFGDSLELRLFNDTELEMVSAEAAAEVPLGVELFLYFGGFTGELVAEGGEVVIRTPGGAEITVLGTAYFVVYDPDTGTTIVGNFGGTVTVTGAGEEQNLGSGTYVVVPDEGAPGPVLPLIVTREAFEESSRAGGSPVQAAARANTWSLEIRHSFVHDYADHWDWVEGDPTFLREWTGQFSIEGERLVGSGTGRIKDVNLKCNNFSDPFNIKEVEFFIEGSFGFDIGGVVSFDENGAPRFEIEISPYDLEMSDLTSIYEIDGNCDFLSEFFLDNNRSIVEDLPIVDTGPLMIAASPGTEAVYPLDPTRYAKYVVGEDPWTYKDIYFLYPIEVFVDTRP